MESLHAGRRRRAEEMRRRSLSVARATYIVRIVAAWLPSVLVLSTAHGRLVR